MNLSALFIKRPVTTTLIMLGILVFGVMAYRQLPVSDLPTVDFPTIQVSASLPGASPETMASAVALPLEKQFSTIAGADVDQLDQLAGQHQHHAAVRPEPQHRRRRAGRAGDDRAGRARAAAADAGAAVATRRSTRRPAGDVPRAAVGDAAAVDDRRVRAVDDRAAHLDGERRRAGARSSARRSTRCASTSTRASSRRTASASTRSPARSQNANVNLPTGTMYGDAADLRRSRPTASCCSAAAYGPVDRRLPERQPGPPRRGRARLRRRRERQDRARWYQGERAIYLAIQKQPGTNVVAVVDAVKALLPTLPRAAAGRA